MDVDVLTPQQDVLPGRPQQARVKIWKEYFVFQMENRFEKQFSISKKRFSLRKETPEIRF